MKNESLSPLEQKIYFAAEEAQNGIIQVETIKSWRLTDDATLRLVIHTMHKKGWLMRLKRGVYAVSEPEKQAIPDPFIVSTTIFSGYNAFSGALYIHKLTDMIPFTVFVATERMMGKNVIGQYSFEAIPLGKRALGSERYHNYIVSSIPKTIYDCLHRPVLAGGLPAVLKAIAEAHMNTTQWNEFLFYAKKFEKDAFYQRLGYLLSLLPQKTPALKNTIGLCKTHVRSTTYLGRRTGGAYNSEWKIIDTIGKEKLLAWWSHG